MRSGTVVGSFKIDLKTVYDAAGTEFYSVLIMLNVSTLCSLSILHTYLSFESMTRCLQEEKMKLKEEEIDFTSSKKKLNLYDERKILNDACQ